MKRFIIFALIIGFVGHSMANQVSQSIAAHNVKMQGV